MKKLFLILAFLITPVFAQPVSEIAKQIPDFASISCKFRQEKEFSGMVVKSSGDFVYKKNKGVTFYTTYPIKSTASYTTKEYRHINNVINAISNKNYSKLEKDFGFDFVKNSDNNSFVIVTEKGVVDRLERDYPEKEFIPIRDNLVCPSMKMTTLEDILNVLENETNEIVVEKEIAIKAVKCIDRMLEASK